MTSNLRSLVAKAYRVRQGRAFCSSSSSSSSSAPNPIGDEGGGSIVTVVGSRCLLLTAGFGIGSYMSGDYMVKYEESTKKHDKYAWDTLAKKREKFYSDISKS
ncbi:hypothetical protein HA466_0056890 [Hirschfeldia incana]|nr:hypothetical protein HA466_0056890 [Hirschfeldia incana]